MALFITQCPHCHTTFRTSVTQLQSADGMVRCGACLKIFVADDHLLPSADLQTLDKPLGAANDSDELDATTEPADLQIASDHYDVSILSTPAMPEPLFTFVEALDTEANFPSQEAEIKSAQLAEFDPESVAKAEAPIVTDSAAAPLAEMTPRTMPAFNALDDFDLSATPESEATTTSLNRQQFDSLTASDAALEFDWEGNAGQKSRSAWWIFSALLLLSTLGLQAIYLKWDELGQNDVTRPWLERLCSRLPCSLASRVDLRAIRTENLMVHSHPDIANALRVTLILRNQSPFEQALPLLNLRFTDTDNAGLAERQFVPSEYLPSALQHLESLPAGAPVEISLDIIDPGIQAINYEVSLSANETP